MDTSADPYRNFTYDTHGNTTSFQAITPNPVVTETHRYDGGDRHVATETPAAAVRYRWDQTDRIVSRTASVTFRAATNADNGAGATTLSIARPPGTQPGDVIVAQVSASGSSFLASPPGWTSRATATGGTAIRTTVFTRVATATDPASWAFALGSTRRASGGAAAYSGVDATTPTGAVATGTTTGTALAASGVTPTRSYSQHVVAWGATGTAAVTGQPAGMVNRVTATTGTSGTRAGLYDRRHDTTDPTGSRTLSVASSVTAAWATLELNPAVVRYGSTGGGDAPDFTQDNAGTLLETVLALPGGVLGNTIYCRRSCSGIVAHEMVHVRQFQQGGAGFVGLYGWESIWGGTRCGNKYERSAYNSVGLHR